MEENKILETAEYVKEKLSGDSSGHDWFHTYRVWKLGKKIGVAEGVNLSIIEPACLLHDIADYKLHGGDREIGPKLAGEWLESLNVESCIVNAVKEIILNLSFLGVDNVKPMKTLEGKCVRDADFLDAMGAIGIARCFAFGGAKGNIMYDPSIPINKNMSKEEYSKANHSSINHFYEKLLLLKYYMETETGKKMAVDRHNFMKQYLSQFFKEWDGEI